MFDNKNNILCYARHNKNNCFANRSYNIIIFRIMP